MSLLTFSESAFDDLWNEANLEPQAIDPNDPLDLLLKVPAELGQGFQREIEWREGLHLTIDDRQYDRTVGYNFESHEHPIQMGFLLAGRYQTENAVEPGASWLCGSGLAAGGWYQEAGQKRMVQVNIHIAPGLCEVLMADPTGEIPPELSHLFKDLDQPYFVRHGIVTPEIQLSLRQLLNCPFQGVTKRIYLESKILELLALMTEQERLAQSATPKEPRILKPRLQMDEIDRVHEARKILLQRLDHPPSLMELARLVGLNDNALKQGFRRTFGTTVFGYLHDCRLEQAQQMLASGCMNVSEVATAIGFKNLSYFSKAFRNKFGINPKDYQMQHKRPLR